MAQIEEPYSGAVAIMEDFYINPPAGCEKLVLNNFFDYAAISAVKTISDKLVKAGITFPTTLLWCKGQIIDSVHSNNMDFGNYHVCRNWQAAIIFGCVYYVLAHNPKIPQKHLDYIEKVIAVDTESKLYFNSFKEPADKLRKELKEQTDVVRSVTPNADQPNPKRLVLTNQSEMARVVKAMAMCAYFKHADGTMVSEAEVGRWLCQQFGVKSTWDSLVQSAFKVENVSDTFMRLNDKAVEHFKKVNKISD